MNTTLRLMGAALVLLCVLASPFASGDESVMCDTQTFAYMLWDGQALLQFRISADGRWEPLRPSLVRLSDRSCKGMAVDMSTRSAFVVTSHSVCRYRVDDSGALLPAGVIAIPNGFSPRDVAVGRSGRFVYILYIDGERSAVAQYRINNDGTVASLRAPAVMKLGTARHIAVHPTKPYLYVTTVEYGEGGLLPSHVAQYLISNDGSLSTQARDHRAGWKRGAHGL